MIRTTRDVQDALDAGKPVVALESSVLAQGLPIPHNREAAHRMLDAVRDAGAVPAVTAVLDGVPSAGIEPDEMERLLQRDGVRKVGARDLPLCVAQRATGATTVSAALVIARAAGIRVFATGGIGGVHRDAPYDESADIVELSRSPLIVVCAGAKSILDLPATLERLETHGVAVIGYRTGELPGFFTASSGLPVPARCDGAGEIVGAFLAAAALGIPGAILVVQPPPAPHALDRDLVDRAVAAALDAGKRRGVTGAGVTPFLLSEVERETGGRSLGANLALLEENASLAARLAVELSSRARH